MKSDSTSSEQQLLQPVFAIILHFEDLEPLNLMRYFIFYDNNNVQATKSCGCFLFFSDIWWIPTTSAYSSAVPGSAEASGEDYLD